MKEKNLKLITEIKKTLNDSEIKNNEEIVEFLLLSKKKLEKNEGYGSVCAKLIHDIKIYLRLHKFKAPIALMNLYSYIQKTGEKFTVFGLMGMFL
ncbi:MAG: bacteriocin immunity protein [Clostridium sp.]